jgi:hypothetical protein
MFVSSMRAEHINAEVIDTDLLALKRKRSMASDKEPIHNARPEGRKDPKMNHRTTRPESNSTEGAQPELSTATVENVRK